MKIKRITALAVALAMSINMFTVGAFAADAPIEGVPASTVATAPDPAAEDPAGEKATAEEATGDPEPEEEPEEGTSTPEQATTYDVGDIAPTEPDKDGEVYQITNAAELYWFAALVNGDTTAETGTGGVEQDTAAKAKLVNDITVNEDVLNDDGTLNGDGSNFTAWMPIGNGSNQYTGTFDGGSNTINGLYFSDTAAIGVGLFGAVGEGGTVQDVAVADSWFEASNMVGGVCGQNEGTLENCANSGTVTGGSSGYIGGVCGSNIDGTLTDCTNSGTVTGGSSSCIGGVCGYNDNGTLTNCTNNGTVTGGGYAQVGGVCGKNVKGEGTGSLTNCYNTGAVIGGNNAQVGGVCGKNFKGEGNATLANCYNTGAVIGGDYATVGGVCAGNSGAIGNATLENCYNTGALTGGNNATVGDVCGVSNGTITNCYYQANSDTDDDSMDGTTAKTADQFASGEVAWLLNGSTATPDEGETLAWYQNLAEGGDTAPVLDTTHGTVYAGYIYDANGFGTTGYSNTAGAATCYQAPELVDGVYQIKNAGNLYWFAALVNGDTSAETGTGGVEQNKAANAKLVNTITVNTDVLNDDGTLNGNAATVAAFRTWTPIGNAAILYKGTFDGGNNTINGLYFSDTAVDNVGLFGFVSNGGKVQDVTVADSWFKANDYVSGVCGYNENGTLTNCSNSGTVSADGRSAYVGGVCAYNENGTLENCTNSGTVSADGGSAYVGGVCGFNNVSSGTASLTNCTNTGTVSATGTFAKVGGVCGENRNSTLENCTNSGTVSAAGEGVTTGGVCGENNARSATAALANCSNSGTVTAVGESATTGGVCGYNNVSGGTATLTSCTNSGAVSGGGEGVAVGGVCGQNKDLITDCTNSGAISDNSDYASIGGVCSINYGGTLSNSTNSGTVTDTGECAMVGGVCGMNFEDQDATATVANCTNTGELTGGEYASIGGVCGSNNGTDGGTATVTNCYNTGNLTGGDEAVLAGVSVNNVAEDGGIATLTNCYNTGDLTGGKDVSVGAVCINNNEGATLTNCYYLAASETDTLDGTTAKTAEQFASGEVAWLLDTAGVEGDHIEVWAQGTASPKFAKADKTDVVYRALFLPETEDTPVAGASYLAAGAVLTAPAGYTWPSNMPAAMPAEDTTYRWTAPVQITTQPTAPAAKPYGYTDTQNLTVVAATGLTGKPITYQWYKDGVAISGATAATYPIPTGLAVGSYRYTCEITCEGKTVTTEPVTFMVSEGVGTLANKDYKTAYTYTGEAIAEPTESNFTTNAGALSFVWYKGTTKLAGEPTAVGSYTLRVSAAATEAYTDATLDLPVTIRYLEVGPTVVPTLEGTKGTGGYFYTPVTVKAPSGYTISKTLDGPYTDSFTTTTDGANTYHLRQISTGYITDVKTITVKYDAGAKPSPSPAPTPKPEPTSKPKSESTEASSDRFTVNAWVTTGGTITPSGVVSYVAGRTATYTITPAAGYRIVKVVVDGVDVGAVSSYTFRALNRNHEIGVYFDKADGVTPATGDDTQLMLWVTLMTLAAAGLGVVSVTRKKTAQEEFHG